MGANMLRSFFIQISKVKWAQRTISRNKLAWRVASRFVAGETLADAVQVVRDLNGRGIKASLDHLGENTASREDATRATEDILAAINQISQVGIQSNVSIKLTQVGLLLDEELARQNLARILESARETHNFVRFDMEDSSCVDKTLALHRWARQAGFNDVGVVIQAYLYRSEQDIQALSQLSGKVRLCKGAYQESPQLAFPLKKEVDQNYDHLLDQMMEGIQQTGGLPGRGGQIPPGLAIATHDPARIAHAIQTANRLGVSPETFEFQMLYGIRRDLQDQLVSQGYAVRVYVPYGTHWYPYFMRRLAERPANVWFFVTNFFRH